MRRSQISQLIQMVSIGISDTTPVDSPSHPEEIAHCRPASRDLDRMTCRQRFHDWHLVDIANLPNIGFAPPEAVVPDD
jgi:hypothetical protein